MSQHWKTNALAGLNKLFTILSVNGDGVSSTFKRHRLTQPGVGLQHHTPAVHTTSFPEDQTLPSQATQCNPSEECLASLIAHRDSRPQQPIPGVYPC